MKHYIIKCLAGIGILLLASCSDLLDEQPHSILTPDLFKTSDGL